MIPYQKEDSVIKPTDLHTPIKNCPETAIITWQQNFLNEANKYGKKQLATCKGGFSLPIYTVEYKDKKYLLMLIAMGGPFVSQVIGELKVSGVKNFVFVGSCGSLDESISTSLIVPTKALRDEGTSYHYVDSLDEFVEVETADFTCSVLKELNIPFVSCPTWTTDCLFRETPSAIDYAKNRGCKCVEMECASIMAVSKFENVKSYQVLFSADSLASEKWKIGRLRNMEGSVYEFYLNTVLELASRVK